MIALRNNKQTQIEEFKNRSVNKKENYEKLLIGTAEKARAILIEDRIPNILRVKQILIDRLENISNEANSKRFMKEHISSELNWELKARSRLLREAKELVKSISAKGNINDFKEAFMATINKKDTNNEWCRGSNRSNAVHYSTLREVRNDLYSFL